MRAPSQGSEFVLRLRLIDIVQPLLSRLLPNEQLAVRLDLLHKLAHFIGDLGRRITRQAD
jgi:hypothetical protein